MLQKFTVRDIRAFSARKFKSAAKENGRISTYSTTHEFQAWDIWCRKYISDDGYVDVKIPENDVAPYEHIVEVHVPLQDGSFIPVTDYASAGKLWTKESKMAAWMLTK